MTNSRNHTNCKAVWTDRQSGERVTITITVGMRVATSKGRTGEICNVRPGDYGICQYDITWDNGITETGFAPASMGYGLDNNWMLPIDVAVDSGLLAPAKSTVTHLRWWLPADDVIIVDDSIVDPAIMTDDTNADGYRVTDGTNRRLAYGRTPDGDIALWIVTNADPILVEVDYNDNWIGACYAMGDAPAPAIRRVQVGYARILQVITDIKSATGIIYPIPDRPSDSDIEAWTADREAC